MKMAALGGVVVNMGETFDLVCCGVNQLCRIHIMFQC